MDFEKLIETRYSSRAYTDEPVSDEDLMAVLNAARLAPTAANRQAFKLIVVHTAGREAELSRIYGREWFVKAPIIICACGIPSENWVSQNGKNYIDVDVAIVMDHLILAAANRGLGTCWIAAFDPAATREVLNIPKNLEPIVITTLGHSADSIKQKSRKAIEEIIIQ
jgi:nitroreductase